MSSIIKMFSSTIGQISSPTPGPSEEQITSPSNKQRTRQRKINRETDKQAEKRKKETEKQREN